MTSSTTDALQAVLAIAKECVTRVGAEDRHEFDGLRFVELLEKALNESAEEDRRRGW